MGGVWKGGGRTKNSVGGALIGQNNDFTSVYTNNSTPWGRVRE